MKIAIAGSHGLIGTNLVTHFRKSNNNDTVMLGEKNEYEPLSREAFVSKMKKKKN